MNETQDLILIELRELRSDFNEYSRQLGSRVSALEVQMYDLQGNGQPGRMTTAENDIKGLQSLRWWLTGAGAVIGALSTFVVHLVFHF